MRLILSILLSFGLVCSHAQTDLAVFNAFNNPVLKPTKTTKFSFMLTDPGNIPAGYNKIIGDPAATVPTATDGTTGWTVTSTGTVNWGSFGGGSANNSMGQGTSDGGGFYFPAAAMANITYNYNVLADTADYNWEISNLDSNKRYRIVLLGSISTSNGVISSPVTTIFRVAGDYALSKEINVWGNTSKVAIFEDVYAASDGTIRIGQYKGSGGDFGILNVLQIQEYNENTPPVVTVPSAPTNFAATGGDAQVSLAWGVPTSNGGGAITNYIVKWGTTSGSTTNSITLASTARSYTHTGRTNGTTYYYRVYATNSAGNGTQTAQLSATPASTSGSYVNVKLTRNFSNYVKGVVYALPPDYNTSGINYPLLISLHGDGETGNGTSTALDKVTNTSIAKRIKDGTWPASFTNPATGQQNSFIVVSPQYTTALQRDLPIVDSVISYFKRTFRVDGTMICLTGLSHGGGTVYFYADGAHYCGSTPGNKGNYCPWGAAQLSAITTMCGNVGAAAFDNYFWGSVKTPWWGFNNSADPKVGAIVTQDWYDTLAHWPVKDRQITIFTSSSHDCWTAATNPNTRKTIGGVPMNQFEWMLQFCRGCSPSDGRIDVTTSIGKGGVSDWARLELYDYHGATHPYTKFDHAYQSPGIENPPFEGLLFTLPDEIRLRKLQNKAA